MRKRAAWKRRGFAIAALVLAFAVVAPELALPAGAASSRIVLTAKRRRRPLLSAAARKAKFLAALKAQMLAKAKLQAAQAPKTSTTVYKGATKKKPKVTAAGLAKLRRALAAKRQAAKRAALNRRTAAAALAARRAARRTKKKKSSSLSLPLLAFLAILPFVLMGIYLLAADYWRRRVPRKRSASLVITRVSDR